MSKEVVIHYSKIKLLVKQLLYVQKSHQQNHLLSRLLTVEAVVSSLDTFVLQYRTFYRSHTPIIVFSLIQYMYVPGLLLLASAFKAALSSLSFFSLATLSSLSFFFFCFSSSFSFFNLSFSSNTFRYSQYVNIVPADFPCLVGNLSQLVKTC